MLFRMLTICVGALAACQAFAGPVLEPNPDVNRDGILDAQDLQLSINAILGSPSPCDEMVDCPFDINGDSQVNAVDLAGVVKARLRDCGGVLPFGPTPSASEDGPSSGETHFVLEASRFVFDQVTEVDLYLEMSDVSIGASTICGTITFNAGVISPLAAEITAGQLITAPLDLQVNFGKDITAEFCDQGIIEFVLLGGTTELLPADPPARIYLGSLAFIVFGDTGEVHDLRVSALSLADPEANLVDNIRARVSVLAENVSDGSDLNGDASLNALDVQTIINIVLGVINLSAPDVTGDRVFNSADIQTVINAVLGIG